MACNRPIRFVAALMVIATLLPAVAAGSGLLAPGPAVAGDDPPAPPPATPPGAAQPQEAFGKNTIGLEFGLALLAEAWNLNEGREWLANGSASLWWAFLDRTRLIIEFHATRVFQARPRNAFVQGFTPIVRWQLRDAAPWGVFLEAGPGISWSDTRVPPRGTRFNYLLLAGTGITRRLGHQCQAVAGVRWLHLSNAGREGRDRNPDIEALGPYAGLTIAF
jgi:hypothetical protein